VVTSLKNRYWEIDTIRGIAIIMMIIFHFLYDLNYFHYFSFNLYNSYFLIYVYFTATLFLLLVGVSLTISYSKVQATFSKNKIRLKFIRRGLFIFCFGLIITFATWIYLSRGFIIFGILHCIGISIILAYPFIRYKMQSFLVGVLFIAIGIIIKNQTFDFPWLLWLGFTPINFFTIDYYPLLPWFGVVLIGISLGNLFYPNGLRKFKLNDKTHITFVKITTFLGRHSLIIYFLHQVILIGILTLISFFY
jgi:uncharacterized membrane protein